MPGKKPAPKDLSLFESQLRMMLGVLTGDIDSLQDEALGAAADGDEGEGYFQEFSLELLQRDESTVQEVLDALDRIRGGSFGRCEMCDQWIVKARLQAMPHARHCIECQRELEKAG